MEAPQLTPGDLDRAYSRVIENAGCAGADGETVDQFSARRDTALPHLLQELSANTYQTFPLLRILIEKRPNSNKIRRLLVPTVRDRILQTAIAHQLSRSFEEEFLDCSFAYRPGRSVDRAIARVKRCRDEGFWWVVDADIRAFFDEIDHTLLYEMIAARVENTLVRELVSQWISIGFWDGARVRSRRTGVPQGSPISPLLANLYLQDLDLALTQRKWRHIRYADDFVVLTQTEADAHAAREMIVQTLARLRLVLQPEKTRITNFDFGFRYLGVILQKDELLIPWKEPGLQGRVLFMPRPMPDHEQTRWRSRRGDTAISLALRQAGIKKHALPNKAVQAAKEAYRRTATVAYLYIVEQGAILRKSSERFVVEANDQVLLEVPYHKLEHVLVFGNVQVTTQAMHEMLEKGVDLSLFSWHGEYRGSISPPRGNNLYDRLSQFELWKDAPRAYAIARAIVLTKLANAAAVIKQLARDRGALKDCAAPLAQLASAHQGATTAANKEQLLGWEGTGARSYFAGLSQLNASGFLFNGRNRQPPRDPLNAMLSFGYVLLSYELASLVESEGLEPCLGCLHEIDRGRPSLALDLVEAFRHPAIDRFVWQLAPQMSSTDFLTGEIPSDVATANSPFQGSVQGVVMTEAARRKFLTQYERFMLQPLRPGLAANNARYLGFRELLRAEVRKYMEVLRSKTTPPKQFQPYIYGSEAEAACDTSSVTT